MKTIICIIGTIGSGKDTVAEYISKKLFIPAFQISQSLRDFAKERGIEPTRENLIKMGNTLTLEHGPLFVIKTLIGKTPENLIVITGIRMTEIIEYMRKKHHLILLAITASPEIRFQRCLTRGKLGEAKTLAEFVENERKENSAPNVQRLFECLKLADYTIVNDADLETFFRKIDEFLKLKELGKK